MENEDDVLVKNLHAWGGYHYVPPSVEIGYLSYLSIKEDRNRQSQTYFFQKIYQVEGFAYVLVQL
jgi:hypothetical protein